MELWINIEKRLIAGKSAKKVGKISFWTRNIGFLAIIRQRDFGNTGRIAEKGP